jgi:hypothetical protein
MGKVHLKTVATLQPCSINDDAIDAGHGTHVSKVPGKLAHRHAARDDAKRRRADNATRWTVARFTWRAERHDRSGAYGSWRST